MRIVLFTPVSQRSAIAGASYQLVEALRRCGADVAVVRTEAGGFHDAPPRRFDCPITSWISEKDVVQLAAGADVNVFQVGDHYGFHAGALRWLTDLPGVVCLHDFFLGNLFLGWQHAECTSHYQIVERLYGMRAADAFFQAAAVDQETFVAATADRAPMTEWVASMATAVLTHSGWAVDRVRAACPGPIEVVPLLSIRSIPTPPVRSLRDSAQPFRLVTIGNANANKRIAQVISAIGGDPRLRALVEFRHMGSVRPEMEAHLAAHARRLGVDFAMLGEVSDEVLAETLAGADGASCLRFPSLEASSASMRDAMLWGLPTLLTNTGSYVDVPAAVAYKIDPDDEVEQVSAALRAMVEEPERARALGLRGREWAIAQGNPDSYARVLLGLAKRSLCGAPLQVAIRRAVRVLGQWQADEQLYDPDFYWEPLRILGCAQRVNEKRAGATTLGEGAPAKRPRSSTDLRG